MPLRIIPNVILIVAQLFIRQQCSQPSVLRNLGFPQRFTMMTAAEGAPLSIVYGFTSNDSFRVNSWTWTCRGRGHGICEF